MPRRPVRRNPSLPSAPPKRRFSGQPAGSSRVDQSALDRVRRFSSEHERTERPFDPTRAPSWRGSSRDLVVNGRMDEFTRGFLETALWSSNDESDESGGEPLDKNYSIGDFDPKCVQALSAECARFQEENADDLAACYEAGIRGSDAGDEFSAGHDFWLTRNGHGAGFWDGDYPEPQATRLTESSEKFGGIDLYIGDDGIIYASGYESGVDKNYRRNMDQTHFPFGSKRAGAMEFPMREFDWEQVDGDANLPQYGGVIGRCDGQTIDLVEIQPVREYVGDNEAAEVGYPFWIKEASYDASDLDPKNKEVKAAIQSSDLDLEETDPEHRLLAIALACMRYGHGSEEAGGGWAGDKEEDEEGEDNLLGSRKVRWGHAGVERKTFAEEAGSDDDDFRREILGKEEPKYVYKMAYEVVTPESAENGDTEENGWEEEGSEEYDSLSDVLNASDIRDKSWIEWSSSHPDANSWLISDADQDFRTGADTSYHLWIERADGEPLSQDELKTISSTLGVRMR